MQEIKLSCSNFINKSSLFQITADLNSSQQNRNKNILNAVKVNLYHTLNDK